MSMFSGKCDLCDHIFGMGGYYDKDGNQVKFNQEGVSVYYSDEIKDFEAFKAKTKGILYQHKHIKEVNEWNQEFVKEHCPHFNFIKHVKNLPDKRSKDNYRSEEYYTYEYFGKEYTKQELKKKGGVYITVKIHFDTLLDLIPYYPYLVSVSGGDTVYITDMSYVDEAYDSHLQSGFEGARDYYHKILQEHYLDVCKKYLLYKIDERTKIIPIDLDKMECPSKPGTADYTLFVDDIIDYNHPIEFVWDGEVKPHWNSPQRIGDHEINISYQNVEQYLKEDIKNGTVKIKYVAYPENGFPYYKN